MSEQKSKTRENVEHILLWLALPLLIGILCAAFIPQPVVGVIYLSDAIDSYTSRDLVTQITYAREHPEIRAVVVVLDSPGGTVADTETVYYELQKLRAQKPVITSVGSMAASGAYYMCVATDWVIARPTSMVGNVGVIGYLPDRPLIYESIVSTGPYKLFGEPRDYYMREMEMIKEGFFEAVNLGRGDRLKLDKYELLTGRIWLGSEALRVGLIDALGSESDAFDKAAKMAKIGNFRTANLRELAGLPETTTVFFYQSPEGVTMPYPDQPGIYLLYIPPIPVEE